MYQTNSTQLIKKKGEHTSVNSLMPRIEKSKMRSFGGQASTFLTGHLEKDFIKIGVILPFENI